MRHKLTAFILLLAGVACAENVTNFYTGQQLTIGMLLSQVPSQSSSLTLPTNDLVLAFESRLPSVLWTDAARTTACVNDGDGVQGWTGTGYVAGQGTAGSKYVYRTNGPNAYPYLDGSGGSSFLNVSNTAIIKRVYAVMRSSPGYYAFGNYTSPLETATGTAYAGGTINNAPAFNINTTYGPLNVFKNGLEMTTDFSINPMADWGIVAYNTRNPDINRTWKIGSGASPATTTRVDYAAIIGYSEIPASTNDAQIISYLASYYLPPKTSPSISLGISDTSCVAYINAAQSNSFNSILRTANTTNGEQVIVSKDISGFRHDFIRGVSTSNVNWSAGGLLMDGGYLATARSVEMEPTGSYTMLWSGNVTNTLSTTFIVAKSKVNDKFAFRYTANRIERRGAAASTTNEYMGPLVALYRYDSAANKEEWWINGRRQYERTVTLTTTETKTPWVLGSFPDGTSASKGTFNTFAFFTNALSTPDILTLTTNHESSAYRIICDGNSITLGTASGVITGTNYPYCLHTNLGSTNFVFNAGVGGRSWIDQRLQAANTVDPFYRAGKTNVLLAFEGTNLGGTSTNNLWQQASNYCVQQRGRGWRVIVGTTIAAANFTNATEYARLDSNEYIRNYWTNFADGLADLATNVNVGVTYSHTNTIYFSDGTHPTVSGYTNIGNIFTGAVKTLLGL